MRFSDFKNFFNKALVFFNPESANYWHTITNCQISSRPEKLGQYYLDFSSKVDYPGNFDLNGIPLYSHMGQPHFYHPIVICQYAFGLFEEFYRSEMKINFYRDKFLKQAEWLVENSIEWRKNGRIWHLLYDIPEYNLKIPWLSALSQGEAISVLTRANQITSDEKYLTIAEQALSPFEVSAKDGGLLNDFEGNIIYEEYPSPNKTNGVLNGFIFSLLGLFDLILSTKSSRAESLFKDGISSLMKLIQYYDIKYWTRYYLFDYPNKYSSSFTYHRLVTEQIKVLYLITGEKIFNAYFIRWNNFSNKFVNKMKALVSKSIYAHKFKD
jgi:heparosan-N-sulfate-glucuronate 5-epimerase